MQEHPRKLDAAFLDSQRTRLRALRNQLLEVRSRNDLEPLDINAAENQQAREYEDDAQRLNASELDGNLANAGEVRLAAVERALQKLDEGSYGYSEASGEPIPIARLQASPEALFTLRGAEVAFRLIVV